MRIRLAVVAALFVVAGCASTQVTRIDEIATTHEAFDARLGFNRVSVPPGSRLAVSMVDGQPAFCTLGPAFFELGGSRGVCFFDTQNSGYLDKYYILGTLRSLTYDAHISYSLTTDLRPDADERARAADMAQCRYETYGSGAVGPFNTAAGMGVAVLVATVKTRRCGSACLPSRHNARSERRDVWRTGTVQPVKWSGGANRLQAHRRRRAGSIRGSRRLTLVAVPEGRRIPHRTPEGAIR